MLSRESLAKHEVVSKTWKFEGFQFKVKVCLDGFKMVA